MAAPDITKTGGSQMNNEDYRIWGKPVRALADGNVEDWVDKEPTNTITVDSNGKLQFPNTRLREKHLLTGDYEYLVAVKPELNLHGDTL